MEKTLTGRNKYDMIMELLALHVKQADYLGEPVKADEIKELFNKYYALVRSK
jgi:hypothetical protein